jgi:hypothetical protein
MRKNYILRFVLFTLILGFCFNSCTVEKRQFRSGYYVNWKTNNEIVSKGSNTPKEHITVEDRQELATLNTFEKAKTHQVNYPVLIASVAKIKNAKNEFESHKLSTKISRKRKIRALNKIRKLRESNAFGSPDEDDEEFNLLGLSSLIFLFTGILAILSIPMAIIAIRQFKKNPGKYKGIWAPVLTLLLSVLVIALFIGIFIAFGWIVSSIAASLAVLAIVSLITIAGILYFSLF